MDMEDTGATNCRQFTQELLPILSYLAQKGPILDLQTLPGRTQGDPNPLLSSKSSHSSLLHQPHPSPGRSGGGSKHVVQHPAEIFGHLANELAVLSKL